eukprot:TRINITY_DN75832_c0_g1_i1.p1 TRINITY_DN75832_c0_g1~~TRINITY_DN75832_c0_g1_i1.p1  ORF type:complete len:232 (+),score=80.05 TRINITY_DN75832_c0_g1_i1:206-901(+)
MKILELTRFAGQPVCGCFVLLCSVGTVLNGMQWEPARLFEIGEAVHSVSWGLLWTLLVQPFYFHTAGEMVMTGALMLSSGVPLERQWGSRKLLLFLLSAHFVGWSVRLLLFLLNTSWGIVLPGPYFACLATVYAFVASAPRTHLFVAYGIPYTAATGSLLIALQLSLLHMKDSLVMSLCGALAGCICSSSAYQFLPSLPYQEKLVSAVLPKKPTKVTILTSRVLSSRISRS